MSITFPSAGATIQFLQILTFLSGSLKNHKRNTKNITPIYATNFMYGSLVKYAPAPLIVVNIKTATIHGVEPFANI